MKLKCESVGIFFYMRTETPGLPTFVCESRGSAVYRYLGAFGRRIRLMVHQTGYSSLLIAFCLFLSLSLPLRMLGLMSIIVNLHTQIMILSTKQAFMRGIETQQMKNEQTLKVIYALKLRRPSFKLGSFILLVGPGGVSTQFRTDSLEFVSKAMTLQFKVESKNEFWCISLERPQVFSK